MPPISSAEGAEYDSDCSAEGGIRFRLQRRRRNTIQIAAPKARNMIARGKRERSERVAPGNNQKSDASPERA